MAEPSLGDLQRAVLRVCYGRAVAPEDLARLGGPASRWTLYRRMIRGRIREAIDGALPRTVSALGPDATGALVEAFLAEAPPATRLVREITPEFLRWLGGRFPDDARRAAPWLPDLARYELALLELAGDDAEIDLANVTEFAMDRVPVLAPARRFLRVEYAVHQPDGVPARAPQALLVYRAALTHTLETLALSPSAADIVARMETGRLTVTECVRDVLAAYGTAADPAFLESLADLLADFLGRRVLLGSAA